MNINEVEACVARAKSGNKEDFLKLFDNFKPFIFKTANQYAIRNHDSNDLLQVGYISLINAVRKYRAGSHTFTAYAFNTIKNEFRLTLRRNAKYGADFSLNE